MAITKTIEIDGQQVVFKASAAIPRIYRIKFGRDIYKDLNALSAGIDRNDPENSNLDTFSLEIFENIAYGNLDATDEEIIEAAKKANIHDYIMEMPEGYDTLIGEDTLVADLRTEVEMCLREFLSSLSLYPGKDHVLPSIRLAQVRDGVEDYNYLVQLERLAAENAAWLEEQRASNDQKSWLSKEREKELSQMGLSEDNREYIEKMREKYAHGDKSLSKDDIKKLIKKDILKRNQIDQLMETAYYEQEAAEWDDKLVTVQEIKFVADQSVNAYGMLTGNQAFANGYSALTNYTETMTDAVVFDKDKGKAFLKATIDTALDMTANKFESLGWGVTGNAFAGAYKQVNDNVYNGRDAWEGTDKAAVKGAVMGAVSKGMGKLKEKSQGTVFGQEFGGSGTKAKVNTDVEIGGSKPKAKVDVETGGAGTKAKVNAETGVSKPKAGTGAGPRKTTIAERRSGQGQYKTNMSEADTKMQISEDVQAVRSMNEVRKLNKKGGYWSESEAENKEKADHLKSISELVWKAE